MAAAEKLGFSWQRMVSRAYHDSLFMAKARSSRFPLATRRECQHADEQSAEDEPCISYHTWLMAITPT